MSTLVEQLRLEICEGAKENKKGWDDNECETFHGVMVSMVYSSVYDKEVSEQIMIHVNGLSIIYPSSRRGVSDVTFAVPGGEIMGLLGPNGAGKSTLIKALSGYILPTAGWFTVGAYDSRKGEGSVGAYAGILFEVSSYFEEMSGGENFDFTLAMHGMKKTDHAILKDFFLEGAIDVPMEHYSFGMRRKVNLAEIIQRRPKVLILDEPFTGLDYASKFVLQKKLKDLAREGAAILLTTNEIAEAEAVCDTVAFITDGGVAPQGKVSALLREVNGLQQIDMHVKNFIDLSSITEIAGVVAVTSLDDRVRIAARKDALPEIIQGVVSKGGSICDIQIKEANLADVFMKKMGMEMQ